MNIFTCQENEFSAGLAQLDTYYHADLKTVYAAMAPRPRPCFTEHLLHDLIELGRQIELGQGALRLAGERKEVEYFVLASNSAGVFNLGGDLNMFRDCIIARDKETLTRYGNLCIDNIWMHLNHFFSPVVKISLVQGRALGGGMEAALAADVIVAEKSASMGLPEILFNLFPGMGALSMLIRRIGIQKAEALILSGEIHNADRLHELGIVDVLVEDGQGELAVREWIARNRKARLGYQAIQRAKNAVLPVTYEELKNIVDIWVESALKLTERDLKLMDRLVRAQNGHRGSGAHETISALVA